VTIDGARGILFNVTGGPDLSLFEVNQAAAIIRETTHPDANLIFGAVIDEKMGDSIRITVIATGFDQQVRRQTLSRPVTSSTTSSTTRSTTTRTEPSASAKSEGSTESKRREEERVSVNNLDIPAFLRRR
jgi:cell division protein FtsZ